MKVQSLSVCVPAGCPNSCKFCVSKQKRGQYVDQIEGNEAFRHLYKEDFKRRLAFARDNGCNTVVLTGDGEPLMNKRFIEDFFEWNNAIPTPFRWIEIQTSGVNLTKADMPDQPNLRWLRNAGVSTIALSLSALDDMKNFEYNGTPEKKGFFVDFLCNQVKKYDFNLRLCLNMTDAFNDWTAEKIFAECKARGADQVTFRLLYESGGDTIQDKWIREHRVNEEAHRSILDYIRSKGRSLERLPFGALRYSVDEMSVVIDDDCMSREGEKETIRYLILREDCHLYSKWDDKGSRIF